MQLLDLIFLFGKALALVIGLYYYNLLPKAFKIVLLQILAALATEAYGFYLGLILHKENAWVFNVYMLCELWFCGVAAYMLGSNLKFNRAVPYLLTIGSGLWALSIYLRGIQTLATGAFIYIGIVLVVLYLNLLVQRSLFKQNFYAEPSFWLSISVVLYFGCIIPYFGLYNVLQSSPAVLTGLFLIVDIFNATRYFLVAAALLLIAQNSKKASIIAQN